MRRAGPGPLPLPFPACPTTLSNHTGTVSLSSSSPTYIHGKGVTDFYALHQFSVPAGADYLNGNITWNAASGASVAFETLFYPRGNVAAYSLLCTNPSGFWHVDVRQPGCRATRLR